MDPQSQCEKGISQQKGLVPRDVVSNYEVNPFSTKEVMANVKVFRTDGRTDGQFKNYMPPVGGIKRENTSCRV